MRSWLNTKPKLIVFFAVLIAGNIFGIYEFVRLARETRVRGIMKDIGTAFDQSQRLPAGPAREEDIIKRLKGINTAYAPPEMKRALEDYTSALRRLLEDMESGRDTTVDEKAMTDARDRMISIEKQYDSL